MSQPRFSPDRRLLLLRGQAAVDGTRPYSVTPLLPDAELPAGTPFNATDAQWGLNALFSVQRPDRLSWTLVAADASGALELVRSAWPIVGVSPLPGAVGLTGQSAYFLRNVGWAFGPTAVRLCLSTGDPLRPRCAAPPSYWSVQFCRRRAHLPPGWLAAMMVQWIDW